jgi:oxygen-dependent protoporphyrinogen oxidase
MQLRSHARLLYSTKKQLLTRPLVSSQCNRSHYSTSADYPQSIGILGGGISGLASAYYISKTFPKSKITIYDKADRLGGWIKSTHVDVPGGKVLFEAGPRGLRPAENSLATTQLLGELALLDDQIMECKKSSSAAQNRYIYYPDKLQRMPKKGSAFQDLLRLQFSGIFGGFLPGILWKEVHAERPMDLQDESIGSFLTRRFGKGVTDNMVSALIHGIYAGDIHQLSIKSIFPMFWEFERKYGGILRGVAMLNQTQGRTLDNLDALVHPYDAELDEAMMAEVRVDDQLAIAWAGMASFSLDGGLEKMVHELEEVLRLHDNVSIQLRHEFDPNYATNEEGQIGTDEDGRLEFTMLHHQGPTPASHKKVKHDLVVTTLPEPKFLADFTPVTVMTVNLFYPTKDLLPVQGFGYLIPQSVPFEQNPERALGVIFDSDVFPGPDSGPSGPSQDTVPGTKLTVMLGGHYWNDWLAYPSQEEGVAMARSVLERHLGIKASPVATQATLNHRCIPQYNVGYDEACLQTHEFSRTTYKGKLRHVGFHYNGIGVNDCIRGAWDLAYGLRGNGWKAPKTGLEKFADQRPWKVKPLFDSIWLKQLKMYRKAMYEKTVGK